ncbi:bifunctional DNA primase/helicase, partial [Seonamhaeicola sp.]|uniref:bifunctional DNA primase/helicase n=1 Tax=Seonamhaeicola sp. TaxID=1912245 RepID=UPI003561F30F
MNTFLDWNTLEFKKQSGKEKLRCPACDATRSDKKDKSLFVNHNEGFGKCQYSGCGALVFREDNQKSIIDSYTDINPNSFKSVQSDLKMLKYINSRGISESTVKGLYVTFESYYQPALSKEVDNIVFNYYEGSKLVNKKFRSANKKFTQISGSKPIFYNINSVIGQKTVYIVEGEFDVLAMYEAGFKNTISVPNGGNDNDDYWKNGEKYLKDVKEFIIAVDNDTVGNILKEKIAQRLGRYRCKYINFIGKDANDDLISGNLVNSINKPIAFPVSGTFTANDLREGVDNLYDFGLPKTIYPKGEWFGKLKDIFSTMRGQVILPTGIPSHGKSTFTDWYVLNLVKDYDMKASWYTPEHSPMDLYETELIQKVLGRNFWKDKEGYPRITKADIDRYDEWANERIYLTDCDETETPTWSWLLDKFKEQMYSFGIDIFVIDAFNKVILPKGNKLDEINNVLTKLTHFARANNVIIFLVAHPTKMQKNEQGVYSIPSLYDVSGSADFRNQVHCGYSIYRYFDENPRTAFVNLKTKYSFQGKIGEVAEFDYCDVNGRLMVRDYHNPCFSLIDNSFDEEPKRVTATLK